MKGTIIYSFIYIVFLSSCCFACIDGDMCDEKSPELIGQWEVAALNNEIVKEKTIISVFWEGITGYICNNFSLEYAIQPGTNTFISSNYYSSGYNACSGDLLQIEKIFSNLSGSNYMYESGKGHGDSFTITTQDNIAISFLRPGYSESIKNPLESRCSIDGGVYYEGKCEIMNIEGGVQSIICDLDKYFQGICKNPKYNNFSQELIHAYNWSYSNGITSIPSILGANIDSPITRAELAKMLYNFNKNILKKEYQNISSECTFSDVDYIDYTLKIGVKEICKMGIMGQGITKFRPNDYVTRAEFGTALSRLLYKLEDGSDNYYSTHLKKLRTEGIINNDNPNLQELRGYAMLMMMRYSNSL